MAIDIRRVATVDELQAVYRFRYAIYVEEMSRPQKDADHDAQWIEDSLDATGYILAAWDGNTIVGTVRSNDLRDSGIGDYFRLYSLSSFPNETLSCTAITTRLMIAPQYRHTSLAVRLSREAYNWGLERGIRTDVIDCNEHLVAYFTGLGYRVHRNDVQHGEYGRVTVMKLDLLDLDFLDTIRSPFRHACREFLDGRANHDGNVELDDKLCGRPEFLCA